MPGVGIGVYDGYDGVINAGDEVSSTYEGRHITVLEQNLIHPNHLAAGLNLVQKGDPVIICNTVALGGSANYGHAVGVAFETATAITDLIAVDTEGIWQLPVSSYIDGAVGSAIVAGDPLFIHDESLAAAGALGLGDALISKIRNLVTQVPFGYALGTMVAAGTGTIAVKVHWDPEEQQDEFIQFLAAHAADDAKSFTITDASTGAGVNRGVHIDYNTSGIKTGGEINPLAVDMVLGAAATMNAYACSVYTAPNGQALAGDMAAFYTYCDDIGVGSISGTYAAIDLNIACNNGAVGGNYLARLQAHGAVADAYFALVGTGATYMFHHHGGGTGLPFHAAAGLYSTADGWIGVLWGAQIYRIPIYIGVD